MILFLLFSLSLASAYSVSSLHVHHSETLKLKCDSLPYRTYFDEGRCYFVIGKKQSRDGAQEECSTELPGAKLISPPKGFLHNFFLDDKVSDFHRPTEAGEKTLALCLYASKIECSSGDQQQLPGGKCVIRAGKKMTYPDAVKFCASKSAGLPVIANSLEQRSIYGILRSDAAWTDLTVGEKRWSETHRYKWMSACEAANSKPLKSLCTAESGVVVLPQGVGQAYSSLSEKNNLNDVICLGNSSSAFWTVTSPAVVVPETTTIPQKFCEEDHRYDQTTGECEWTGPVNACAKLVHYYNQTWYIPNPTNIDLFRTGDRFANTFNDWTVRAVVRRGCHVTIKALATGDSRPQVTIVDNKSYGNHNVPCYYTGTLTDAAYGATMVHCQCSAPLKKIEPAHVEKSKYCADDHRYDPTTGECEWTGPKNACAKLIHFHNQTWFIPNPSNIDLWTTGDTFANTFNDWTVRAVVRRGCRLTIGAWALIDSRRQINIVDNASYGNINVPCAHIGTLDDAGKGATAVHCQCTAPLKNIEPEPVVKSKDCVEDHKYDSSTGECEWTGPKNACAKLVHVNKQTLYVSNPTNIDLWRAGSPFNDMTVRAVVRRGCRLTIGGYAAGDTRGQKNIVDNASYGNHNVPCNHIGTIAYAAEGATMVYCKC